MTETGYVYGAYTNYQQNLDPGKTKSRFQAKWRSQYRVRFDLGLGIVTGSDEYFRLTNVTEAGEDNFSVNIVHLDDLEYELRSTDDVDDFFWIYKAPTPTIGGRAPIGRDVKIVETFIPIDRISQTQSPNPDPFAKVVPTPKAVTLPNIPFAEVRLELGYDYGAVGGPSFSTEVVKTADEREQRNSLHHLPLGRWQLGDRMVAESEQDLLEEVSYLKQFHSDRQGSYQGFRYKDWADFEAPHQLVGIGDGTTTQWQLRKGYWVGDVVTWRPIQKPVAQTVVIYANGESTEVASVPGGEGWTVDHETGVISNPEPLAVGVVITASFEFDVPVRFENDAIGFSLQGYEPETDDIIYRLESVFVKEIRLPLSLPWDIQPATLVTEELDLGIIYDTVERYSFATERQQLRSGWELAKPNRDESKLVLNLGNRNYDREEADKIIAYFWNARGKKAEFPLINLNKNYEAKFQQDRINLKFLSDNKTDKLFEFSGVKLKVKEKSIYRAPPFSVNFQSIFINPEANNDPTILQFNKKNYQFLTSQTNKNGASLIQQTEGVISSYGINGIGGNGAGGGISPPGGGGKPIAGNYQVQHTFWTAGTLYLIVTNSSYPYVNYLYRLTISSSKYKFEYVKSQLENYKLLLTSTANRFNRIFPGSKWIYLISAADDDVSSLSSRPKHKGILIWSLSNGGVETAEFIPNSVEPSLNDIGYPNFVFDNKLFLNCRQAGTDLRDLGIKNGLQVYASNLSNQLYLYPLQTNLTLDEESFLLPGRLDGVYKLDTADGQSKIIENYARSDREIYSFYDSGTNRTPIIEYSVEGKDGSYFTLWKTRHHCIGNLPDCTSSEDADYYQILFKPSWNSPWELIDGQNNAETGDATRDFQSFSPTEANRPVGDRNGNLLLRNYNNLIFYRKGSGNGIRLNGLLPSVDLTKYRDSCPTENYGLCLLFHSRDLFSQDADPYLVFVQ